MRGRRRMRSEEEVRKRVEELNAEYECLRCGYIFEYRGTDPKCPECGTEEVVVLV